MQFCLDTSQLHTIKSQLNIFGFDCEQVVLGQELKGFPIGCLILDDVIPFPKCGLNKKDQISITNENFLRGAPDLLLNVQNKGKLLREIH